jgi:riboflavin synthase
LFTGIIEEMGRVQNIRPGANVAVLTIAAEQVLTDVHLGDSIAVNGVCLTVTSFSGRQFTADVMHETLRRSALGRLRIGDRVNLERAMAANGRFGGHFVSGHIDGTGVISAVRGDGNAIWYTVKAPMQILRYIVEKGSVALDGVSLTVAAVDRQTFAISMIPHTAAQTSLSQKKAGDLVNIETDCIGKYVEKLLGTRADSGSITKEFLRSYQF